MIRYTYGYLKWIFLGGQIWIQRDQLDYQSSLEERLLVTWTIRMAIEIGESRNIHLGNGYVG